MQVYFRISKKATTKNQTIPLKMNNSFKHAPLNYEIVRIHCAIQNYFTIVLRQAPSAIVSVQCLLYASPSLQMLWK